MVHLKSTPATDSARDFRNVIGDDATAEFESDPTFVNSNPASSASSENLAVQRDTDDTEDSDEEIEDDDEDVEDEEDEDDLEEDEEEDEDDVEDEDEYEDDDEEDEDDEDLEDDEDEVGALAA